MFGIGWTVLVVVAAAGLGATAGAGARLLLRRMTRGAVVRPPWCETAVSVGWAATGLGWVTGVVPLPWTAVLLGLTWLGTAVAVVDLRHRRIPDALTLPALPVALLCAAPLGGAASARALVGAVLAVAVHAAVHLVSPRAMGAGDVKLAAPLGAVQAAAGWVAVPAATVLAAVVTAVVGVVGAITGTLGRRVAVPHGPSMVLATALVTGWLATAPGGLPPPG